MADHLLEYTRTLCPDCLQVVDGHVVERGGNVYMRRFCPTHGMREGIISGDVNMYTDAAQYNKPGTRPLRFGATVRNGCPYDCGLCSEHKQHTCLALVEVTNACNMRCPTCFASSGVGEFKDLETIDSMITTFTSHETNPEVLMISGGEPPIHPQIIEIVELAKARGVKWVVVNTNGKRVGGPIIASRRVPETLDPRSGSG
jgi:hypothetical protein